MIDLDCDLDTAVKPVRHLSVVPPLAPSPSATNLVRAESQWSWTDLRDYVLREIEKRHGPQVRQPLKESGIFKGFISRWGIDDAIAIAKYAFEVERGMWVNAPITMTRFTRGNDPFFAQPIAARVHSSVA